MNINTEHFEIFYQINYILYISGDSDDDDEEDEEEDDLEL